jgi:hypothetical protein
MQVSWCAAVISRGYVMWWLQVACVRLDPAPAEAVRYSCRGFVRACRVLWVRWPQGQPAKAMEAFYAALEVCVCVCVCVVCV